LPGFFLNELSLLWFGEYITGGARVHYCLSVLDSPGRCVFVDRARADVLLFTPTSSHYHNSHSGGSYH